MKKRSTQVGDQNQPAKKTHEVLVTITPAKKVRAKVQVATWPLPRQEGPAVKPGKAK